LPGTFSVNAFVPAFGASAQAIGEWYFDISWGAIPEEGHVIANCLMLEGYKRLSRSSRVAGLLLETIVNLQ
jgi:hypothetical protein